MDDIFDKVMTSFLAQMDSSLEISKMFLNMVVKKKFLKILLFVV